MDVEILKSHYRECLKGQAQQAIEYASIRKGYYLLQNASHEELLNWGGRCAAPWS